MTPPPSHRASQTHTPSHVPAGHRLCDELDLAVLVAGQMPWQLASLHAALAADLGRHWRGGALVVDDAAPPATAQAAREALATHHPLARRTVLRLHRRRGTAAATNLALDELTAEYVAVLQAGTRPEPGTLVHLTEALDAAPDALWAAPPAPGLAVLRRPALLELGGFDPGLRGADAVAECAARARAAGHRVLVLGDALVHRDVASVATHAHRMRGSLARRRSARRPWTPAALAVWLPDARLGATRLDLA